MVILERDSVEQDGDLGLMMTVDATIGWWVLMWLLMWL